MPTAPKNATSFSVSSSKLRVDFFESGVGDTIIVTFPDGGIGIVDAHPSSTGIRPPIEDLIQGKHVHFVCLTHPHADHGIDLIPVLQKHSPLSGFWHTTSDINSFLYRVQETVNYPSELSEFATRMNQEWANFLIDLFGAVADRDIPRHLLRSDLEAVNIAGVDIHVLAPEETLQNRFNTALMEKINKPERELPNTNLLSAVLALHYGGRLILLGADALQANWTDSYKRWSKKRLPKACILKVPHHGAKNSLDLRKNGEHTYLDMCEHVPNKAKAVLFAGDRKHPNPKVHEKLRSRTELFCLSNGLYAPDENPLNLKLPGAKAVIRAKICQPKISFEIDASGNISTQTGVSCEACAGLGHGVKP